MVGTQRLDVDALTFGFARRFAPYKRANLLLQDRPRLTKLLHNTKRPVQLLFAGKSHPADQPGKDVQIVYVQNYASVNEAMVTKNVDAMCQSEPFAPGFGNGE